jgi:hypothetical protein
MNDIPQVSLDENSYLTTVFTENDIREAIFQMEHNKAPGPDGFPAEFYQVFWNVIKNDLLALFDAFHKGELPLFRLNFGHIILVPKSKDAMSIQHYRPICLLNVSFKIFTKVLTNRVSGVASKVIGPSQTAFIPGRNIMEGVVVLHETIHELRRKKDCGVILKLDFEKAYDKIKWPFVQQTLRMKGFSEKWCAWINSVTTGGHVGIKVNDHIGANFQTYKGLRQGDPLSPILFNIVVDMLAILVNRAKEEGQFEGLIPHLVDGGLSILQYADDTVLFLQHDLAKAANLKLLLITFEQVSGLKINYHKSELFGFGLTEEEETLYLSLFRCQKGGFPFRYLGIPMHYRKLSNSDWKTIEIKFEKKLSSWKGKLMSVGGRLVLINSVLTSLVMFMLSFFEVPKGVLEKIDYYRSRFFWQGDHHKKSIDLHVGIFFVNLKTKEV